MKQLLVLPHLAILNANAHSSPFTIGFPAVSAWLGAAHALERLVCQSPDFKDFSIESVGIVSHCFDLKVFKDRKDYTNSLIGTGNPLNKDGKRSSFIEEARCSLNVSLILSCKGVSQRYAEELILLIEQLVQAKMKIAGGDILEIQRPYFVKISDEATYKKFLKRIMPGFVLIERRDLLQQGMGEGLDSFDALIEYLAVENYPAKDESETVVWKKQRKSPGWIVPIAVGYYGISEICEVEKQRAYDVPHRFVESLVTLGEFVMPYRLAKIEDMLWQYEYDKENCLYACKNTMNL